MDAPSTGLTSPIFAVDTETTGLTAFRNEAIEIGMVPLNPDFTVNENVEPFHALVRPEHPEFIEERALAVNGFTVEEIMTFPERKETVRAFNAYFESVVAPAYKKIHVLAQNGAFDKGFLSAWLDPERKTANAMDLYFHYQWRDTQASAMFLNDKFTRSTGKPVFYSVSLGKMAKILQIEHVQHRAIGDCKATAAVYRKMAGFE